MYVHRNDTTFRGSTALWEGPIAYLLFIQFMKSDVRIPASSKVGLISAFCPINRFFTRTTFLGKPEFLLIYCCQARFSAAKMPDQTAKLPDQTAKIPDHVGWQFLTTAFIFRKGVFPQERRQFYCFWATAEISTIWKIQVWGLSKIMVPKNCPYAALSRTFRAPAESGHRIMIGFSFIYRFINSGIHTFREPYAAFSPTAAKHTHPYLQMALGY